MQIVFMLLRLQTFCDLKTDASPVCDETRRLQPVFAEARIGNMDFVVICMPEFAFQEIAKRIDFSCKENAPSNGSQMKKREER